MTNSPIARKSVVIVDTQPLTIEGMKHLLETRAEMKYAGGVTSLANGIELVRNTRPTVVIVDKAFGLQPVIDWLPALKMGNTAAVVWGSGISDAEALRLAQAGVRGVAQKTSDIDSLLSCIQTTAAGGTWMSDTILETTERDRANSRSSLTAREQQVADLVERGMRNKEIGSALGIQTGTVKIHLKHIFEKTGCRGRYGLALSGLREKGQLNHIVM